MMLLMKDIIDDKNPLIREKSELVELPLSEENCQLINDMMEFLTNSQDEETSEELGLRPGVGLAAIQLGIKKRICCVLIYDYDEEGEIIGETAYALVNPKIVSHSERVAYLKDGEGCLSVNEEYEGYVPRYAKITVKSYDALQGKDVTIVARGYEAIVLQHEIDHLDGNIFYDHINKNDPFTKIDNALEI